jgi:hypothetical protein
MNQFIKNLIPLLFLIVVYIILFLDQDNNPYNKILKLDLKKSKNTFQANDLDDQMPMPIMHYKLNNDILDTNRESNRIDGTMEQTIFESIIDEDNIYENKPDYAVKFNGGDDDYIEMPPKSDNWEENILSAKNWNGFSFAGWIFWEFNNGVPVSQASIFDFGKSADLNNIFLANPGSSTNLKFQFRNGKYIDGNRISIEAKNYLENEKWIHVAVTFSNITGKAKIYKNGKVVAEEDMKYTSTEGKILPLKIEYRNRNKAYIGKSNWSYNSNFKGQMSNLYFFNQELSSNHIQSLFEGKYNDNPIKEKKQNESTSEETKRDPIDNIQINPNWLRFFEIK